MNKKIISVEIPKLKDFWLFSDKKQLEKAKKAAQKFLGLGSTFRSTYNKKSGSKPGLFGISNPDTVLLIKINRYYWDTLEKPDYDNLISLHRVAISINPQDSYLYNRLGQAYFNQGKYPEALQCFNQAIKIKGKDDDLFISYSQRGELYLKLKNYDQALVDFTEANKLNNADYKTIHNLGLINLELGRYKEAYKNFNELIEVVKNKSDTYLSTCLADFYVGRGTALLQIKQGNLNSHYKNILGNFNKALSLNKANFQAYLMAGKLYNKLAEYKHALEIFNP